MKQLVLFKIYTSLFLLIITLSAKAQISSGGMPPSLEQPPTVQKRMSPYIASTHFDVMQLKREDAINEELGMPLRVARIIDADLNMENIGDWSVLENGQRIWRLTLRSNNSIAIILSYEQFYIPQGGKLFLYNADRSHILGAYTETTNPSGNEFTTEALAGDEITLEYVEPLLKLENEIPRIHISGIGYCYNYLSVTKNMTTRINESASCQVNINCAEGNDWQNEKKGVTRTLTPIGDSWYLCSGSLVNNTSESLKPYFLSAHHCFYDELNTRATFNQMLFYFHYESPDCDRPTIRPTTTKTMVGAQLLVDIDIQGGSDGALLLLNNDIPSDYDVFYNGWDISGNTPQRGVGIHHPRGDVKKISTYARPATSATWRTEDGRGVQYGHWNVRFVSTTNGYSVTEGGSSGSPIFDENKLIVGTLTGGSSSCSNGNGSNYYGKMEQHWDKFPEKMKDYLDPQNTGKTALEGRYLIDTATVNFISNVVSILEGDSIEIKNLSYKAKTFDWTFEGGTPKVSTLMSPIIVYRNPGRYSISLIINKGLSTEKTLTKDNYIEVNELMGSIVSNSLHAYVDGSKDRINLEWDRKGLSVIEKNTPEKRSVTMRRGNLVETNELMLADESSYRILSRWTVSDMEKYTEINLIGLNFILNDKNSLYTLKIIQGENEIYSKEISLESNIYIYRISLDRTIKVDLTKDLFFGYEVKAPLDWSISYNSTPVVAERNMLSFGGKNYYSESFNAKGNWNIQAETLVIIKPDFWYTIYRDGQMLATNVISRSFVDHTPNMSRMSHCYTMTTSYRSGFATKKEQQVCVDLPVLFRPIQLITDHNSQQLRIISQSIIKSVCVYDLGGRLLACYDGNAEHIPLPISTDTWRKGVYIIMVQTDKGVFSDKVMI